jgi:predicted RNase H-like nuclease
MHSAEPVIGIDVGGPRKGFHAVALVGGRCFDRYSSTNAALVAKWCLTKQPRAIGIDAPCRWSKDGRARPAEKGLAAARIFSFATPTVEGARSSPFHQWMIAGAELYRHLAPAYPLLQSVTPPVSRFCFETFPHAVACHLAGTILSARNKRTDRRQILKSNGVATELLTNIDWVDAALCALTADLALNGNSTTYGDAETGFIVVPAHAGI